MHTIKEGSGIFSDVVPSLVEILRKGNRADKYRAIEALRAIGPDSKSAVDALIEFLDVQHKLQGAAAAALEAIGPAAKKAVEPLCRIMLRECPTFDYAHYNAASALGSINDESAISALIEASKNPAEQGPNWRAIDSLGKFGPKAIAAVPTLIELLSHPQYEDMRGNILHGLSQIGPANGIGCVAIMDWISTHPSDEYRSSYVMNLYHILFSGGTPHPDVAPMFIGLLKDNDSEVVHWSALALGHLKEDRAVSELIEVASSNLETRARVEAIRSLGLIGQGSEDVLAAMAKALHDPGEEIRCIAAFALGWIGAPARKLLPLLKDCFESGKLRATWLKEKDVIQKIEG